MANLAGTPSDSRFISLGNSSISRVDKDQGRGLLYSIDELTTKGTLGSIQSQPVGDREDGRTALPYATETFGRGTASVSALGTPSAFEHSQNESEREPDKDLNASYTRFSNASGNEDDDEDKDVDKQREYEDTSPTTSQIDLFGTSIPKKGFFTPSSTQNIGLSYVRSSLQSGRSSYGPPQSFATARSSLASYATAASGPRKIWAHRGVSKLARSTTLADEKDKDSDALVATGRYRAPFELLEERILQRILFGQPTPRDDVSYVHFVAKDFEKILRPAVRRQLQPLEDPPGWDMYHSLEPVISSVVDEAHSFLIHQEGNSWARTDTLPNLRRDVARQIYEYASTPHALRDLVPAGQPERGKMSTSEWLVHLNTRGLILDDTLALDWSGRGQHVEYAPDEEHLIPLKEERILGYSATAVVQSVRCRRIILARKTVRCNRRLNKEIAIIEVEHLQRLQHRHIIRLVGTYTHKRVLAILLYPVAHWNLEEYMDELVETKNISLVFNQESLKTFLGCLSNAIKFIHDHNVKHMDIKPGNLLIRNTGKCDQIYIADFGIARAYKTADESYTDSPISFTRIYAAPEVVTQDTRGLPADIFSLGCVFMEILSTLVSTSLYNGPAELLKIRSTRQDKSYHMSIQAVLEWYAQEIHSRIVPLHYLNISTKELVLFASMLRTNPYDRPTAAELAHCTQHWCCGICDNGVEPFEAAGEAKRPES